jgi:hypothetical protein
MPARSDKAADKLMAALRYTYREVAGQGRKTAEYAKAPLYYDALWQWYQTLSAGRQELVSDIIDAWAFADRRKAAETWGYCSR